MKKILFILSFISAAISAQTIAPDSAKYHVGSLTIVCGKVYGTHQTKTGTTFINFGDAYPNSLFTAVIFGKDTGNFKEYNPAEYLKNKYACVTGMIKMHKEKAEVNIKGPNQIRIQDNPPKDVQDVIVK